MFRVATVAKSSTIRQFAYHPGHRILRIVFKSGGAYEYANVPPEIAGAMFVAESVGSYFAATIRNAGFEYRKIVGGCIDDEQLEATA